MLQLCHSVPDGPINAISEARSANDKAQNIIYLKNAIGACREDEHHGVLARCHGACPWFDPNHIHRLLVCRTRFVDRTDWFIMRPLGNFVYPNTLRLRNYTLKNEVGFSSMLF